MTREKSYTPVASYEQLKLAETAVTQATTADHIREATRQHGAKIGYKAFATSVARYLLTGKMTPEGMKPDEAAERPLPWKKLAKQTRRRPSTASSWPNIRTTRWPNKSRKARLEFPIRGVHSV
jgi:PAB1-binding protein PBP1